MLVEQVKKLSPIDRFIWWIKERHQIYLRKESGLPKPWTNNEVLQQFFFTNPYRENDKVTKWFRENIRVPLRDDPKVLMATIIFRWFNKIETGKLLWGYGDNIDGCCDLITKWNEPVAINLLKTANEKGPVFTAAYMIKCGNGPPGCKIPMVCSAISEIWKDREHLVEHCIGTASLQLTHKALCQYRGLGGFMAYEIVTDLRHTYLLENATDINTWANPGPGAERGLSRMEHGHPDGKVKDQVGKMVKLLAIVRSRLLAMPKFELREIEHSLCEWDKYERAVIGDGKMKRRYNGKTNIT